MKLSPLRITRNHAVEWDRRRGIALTPFQRNLVGIATRLAGESLPDGDDWKSYEHKDARVQQVPGPPPAIRVTLSHGSPYAVDVDLVGE